MARSLSDLTSPAAVQSALDEFLRLGQTAFLRQYGFRRSSSYMVRDPRSGLWADSKAIAGAAIGHQFPGEPALRAADFSGGIATVVRKLSSLGFEIKPSDDIAGRDWQRSEVELIVADYVSMLLSELAGQPYNKAAHRRQLLKQLPGRSAGAVEFKHCNISAVMLELGFPYVAGYLPRSNFQRSVLVDIVSHHVARHKQLDELALAAVERPAVPVTMPDFTQVQAAPPSMDGNRHVADRDPRYVGTPIQRDYLAREERNRSLGLAGEAFALDFERWRLTQLGAGQLAERVTHASVMEGDGLGYDIRSFEADGRERFIEVKTTSFGERTPFFVSSNEVSFAREHEASFRLYRLFDFRKTPRLFELAGPIERHCRLEASTFRASFA